MLALPALTFRGKRIRQLLVTLKEQNVFRYDVSTYGSTLLVQDTMVG